MLEECFHRAIRALWLVEADVRRSQIDRCQLRHIAREVDQELIVFTRIEGLAAVAKQRVGDRNAIGVGETLEWTHIAEVVDGRLQLAMNRFGAEIQRWRPGFLEAEGHFVLIGRLHIARRQGIDNLVLAIFVIARQRLAQLRQTGRRAVRVGARVGEVLRRKGRAASATHRDVGRDRHRVAAQGRIHLEARIAVDVPHGGQARLVLVLHFQEGRLRVVLVLERFITHTQRQQQVRGCLETVFQIPRALFTERVGDGRELVASDVIAQVAQRAAGAGRCRNAHAALARDGRARHAGAVVGPPAATGEEVARRYRLDLGLVEAAAQRVGAKAPFDVETARIDDVFRARGQDVAGDVLRVGVAQTRRARIDRRRDLEQVGVVTGEVVLVRRLRTAIQGGDGQVVSQVADVAQGVDLGAVVVDVDAARARVDDTAAGAGRVIEAAVRIIHFRRVAQRREFKAVIVGDVPVDLGHVALDLGVTLAPADGGIVGGHAEAVDEAFFGFGFLGRGKEEQLVLDDRAADVSAVHLLVPRIFGARQAQRAIGIDVVWRAGIAVVDVFRRSAQRFRFPGHDAARFPGVGAALGDDVDDAADRAAEFGAEAAGQHLRFSDRAEWQLGGAQAGQRVGDRETVDVVRVLGRCAATERCTAGKARVGGGGVWRELNDGFDGAADRQRCQFAGIEGSAAAGAAGVDGGAGAGHLDDLRTAGRCCGGGEDGFAVAANAGLDVDGADDTAVTQLGHAVRATRQRAGNETALCIRGQGAADTDVGILDENLHIAARGDGTEDTTRCIRLRHCRRHCRHANHCATKGQAQCVN